MDTQPEISLIELIYYNNWANAQVLAACQNLTAGQLSAAAPGAHGTIRDTLAHIIRAEADYVGQMTGNRTNITTILSGLGLPTPEVDGWAYLFSHPDRFEMKTGSL